MAHLGLFLEELRWRLDPSFLSFESFLSWLLDRRRVRLREMDLARFGFRSSGSGSCAMAWRFLSAQKI